MKKITVHVHTSDAEHWVTMNGAAVLVDGTEGGGFTVKGGAGGKLTGIRVNPKSMSEPRLNAKTSQFNRPDFKPAEPKNDLATTSEVDWGRQQRGAGKRAGGGMVSGAMSNPPTGIKTYTDPVGKLKASDPADYAEVKVLSGDDQKIYAEYRGEGDSHHQAIMKVYAVMEGLPSGAYSHIPDPKKPHESEPPKPVAPAKSSAPYGGAPKSWVIREKSTGKVMLETFDPAKVAALNTAKYEAVSAMEHLQGVANAAAPKAPQAAEPRSLESSPAALRDPKTGNTWSGRGIAPQWAKEMLARGEPLGGPVPQKPARPAPAAKPAGFLGANADPAAVNAPLSKRGDLNAQIDRHKAQQAAEAKTKAKELASTTRAEKAEAKALISEHGPAIVAKMGERFGAKSIEGMLDQWAKWEQKKAILFVNKFKAEQAAAQAAGSSQAAPSARQYVSAAKLDHPSVGALNNATAQKEAAHARLKSINRKDDPLGHLKADSAHRDAVRNEASAREAVEAAANRLGQTTISPAGAKKAAGEDEKFGSAGASSEEAAAKKDFTGAWIARNFPAPTPGQRVRASQMVSEAVKQEKAEAVWSAYMAPNKVKARELLANGGKDWQGERVYFNGVDIGAVAGNQSDVYFDIASGKWHGAPEAVSKIKSKFGG